MNSDTSHFDDGGRQPLEVAVIGAGQAGLAIGYHLARQGRRFVILERAGEVAPAWRERWDSLMLFTPRRYSGLPGLPFPGDLDSYPSRDEVIAYLESYAKTFELPIEFDTEVRKLENDTRGFRLQAGDQTISADQVIVATGPFQTPYVPKLAEKLEPAVFQTHAVGYRRPSDVPGGTVLVVGGGNTGFQIAKELSATHRVVLSIGSRQMPLPQRLLGRDLFWWLGRVGILNKNVESHLGRKLKARGDTLIGSKPGEMTKRYGVELKPRLVEAHRRHVAFADGSGRDVDSVIWATGYRPDYSWITLPIFDAEGRLRHRRGVTDVPGLYFLGLPWQYTRGSALIGFIKDDAHFIAKQAGADQESKAPEPAQVPLGTAAVAEAHSTERT